MNRIVGLTGVGGIYSRVKSKVSASVLDLAILLGKGSIPQQQLILEHAAKIKESPLHKARQKIEYSGGKNGILCISMTGIEDNDLKLLLSHYRDIFKSIHTLYMYSNKIQDISVLTNFPNLKKLALDSNHIEDISPLLYLKDLEELSLESNPIRDASPLLQLKNIKVLSLNGSHFEDVLNKIRNNI